ncbi:MAG: acylphosphatase [bacterium]|nr:acylphosphatase [bacterium]
MKAILATVSGRVQGVGFRYTTRHRARALGLTGWVRNQHDGSVLTFVQGDVETVDAYIAFLGQGPPAARVASLDVREAPYDPTLTEFRVV